MEEPKEVHDIDGEEFEYAEQDEILLLRNGIPFTGTGVFKFPDGRISIESEYVDGLLNGIERRWYQNGVLKMETHLVDNITNGECTEWYKNGELKTFGLYEQGTALSYKEWNEAGELIENYILDQDDPEYKFLERLRKMGK